MTTQTTQPTLSETPAPVTNPVIPMDNPAALPPVDSGWAALGIAQGYQPLRADELRAVILSFPGEGKTTLASSIPGALLLDFERGASGIPYSRGYRIPIPDYQTFEKVHTKLIADAKAGRKPFTRIIYDTIDRWVDIVETQLSAEKSAETGKKIEHIGSFGEKGHGWFLLKNRCWSFVEELESVGYPWMMIGHLKEESITINNQNIVSPAPALSASILRPFRGQCEMFCLMRRILTEVKTPRKVPLPDGTTIIIEDVASVPQCVLQFVAQEVGVRQGKKRAVPTMRSELIIPNVDGWLVLKGEYDKAVEDIKQRIASGRPIPIEPNK